MKNLTIRNSISILAVVVSLNSANTAYAAKHHDHHSHGATTPIGVMGDHLMAEGQWMLSYRFMNMDMEGNRTGTDRVATPLPGFMVSPLQMNMDMHMIGGMLGINDDLTVMLMLPFVSTDMDHVVNGGMMAGTVFNTEASGIGDVKVSATYKMNELGTLLNVGLAIPTGSIDEKDDIPASMGTPVQLPYPMQLGSGTYDLMLGATKIGDMNGMNWGLQGTLTLRTGENDNGYTLGDAINLNAWLAKQFDDGISGSFRLNIKDWDNIDGADTRLAPMPTVPTKNTDLRGGTRVDASVGVNFTMGNHTIGLEYGVPVHQDLDGPQLETDSVITIGWQGTY